MSRTKIQMDVARELMRKPRGQLTPVDLAKQDHPDWMTRCFVNNRYIVMIEDGVTLSTGETAIKAMIQRHDDQPIPNHWREIQNIKNEIFGPEQVGIEYYPAESELSDKANIYWLWVFPDGDLPRP